MKIDVFVMHTICVVHRFFFFLSLQNLMKCSFFRYYICVFDIDLFTLNEDLFICQQPVASNTDALKITPMFASKLARDVMMASYRRHCDVIASH